MSSSWEALQVNLAYNALPSHLANLTPGVGYAVAEAALEHGCEVTISSSNHTRIESAINNLRIAYPTYHNKIHGYPCDVSTRATIEANLLSLLQQTSRTGPLDHIVWTAGDPVPPTPITEATLEAIEQAMTVRYIAPILLAKHAMKYLRNSFESSITLTTGIIIERPIPNWSVIAGGRSAVVGLARNLALDLAPVRVNAVALRAVDTGTWATLPEEAREKMKKGLVQRGTTGRIGRAEDVAEAYVYLMKDGNITGAVVGTNGGALLK